MDGDAVAFRQFCNQIVQGQVGFLDHPLADGGFHHLKLAVAATVALRAGASPPVSRFRMIMSLTNFTETWNRAAVARCEYPSSTQATTRSRRAIGCGLPIQNPHICYAGREAYITLRRNPESG